ncbi:SAM-dependent methyltransferase [Streptomyces sp. NPDC056390]|uniref:SAM-dependent methyltransferase n=1 Tax=Streptomyces sp. NPDC056390 TaxID=3345806 RepID=UPI0035E1C5AE
MVVEYWNGQGSAPMTLCSRVDLVRLFGRVELLEPGNVSCSRWRPEVADEEIVDCAHFGGVAGIRGTTTPMDP